jgi:hypothetical protein
MTCGVFFTHGLVAASRMKKIIARAIINRSLPIFVKMESSILVVVVVVIVVLAIIALWSMQNMPIITGMMNSDKRTKKKLSCIPGEDRCERVKDTMSHVDMVLKKVANEYSTRYGHVLDSFELIEHEEWSFTHAKKTIYLNARRNDGEPYEKGGLTYVALHELSHVLCSPKDSGCKNHGKTFDLVNTRLQNIAQELGYWNGELPDASYPQWKGA